MSKTLVKHEDVGRRWAQARWFDPVEGEGDEFLRESTQVNNVWIPSW